MPDYSFAAALRHLAAPQDPESARAAEAEIEASRELARGATRGLAVPADQLARAMNTATSSEGPELVGEVSTGFAGALRARAVTAAAGATVLTGLRSDVHIPTLTAGADTYWIDEGEAVTSSQPSATQGVIKPKTVAASTAVSRRLMLQGSPDVAGIIAADLMRALAHEIDAAALGASQDAAAPAGLRQALAGQKEAFAGAVPTYFELLNLLEDVEDAHQLAPAWVLGTSLQTALRKTDTGFGRAVLDRGQIADRPALATPAMPDGEIVVGGFGDLIIGQWGGVDLRLDPLPGAASDMRVLRAFADVGFLVRRASSFAFGGPAA